MSSRLSDISRSKKGKDGHVDIACEGNVDVGHLPASSDELENTAEQAAYTLHIGVVSCDTAVDILPRRLVLPIKFDAMIGQTKRCKAKPLQALEPANDLAVGSIRPK